MWHGVKCLSHDVTFAHVQWRNRSSYKELELVVVYELFVRHNDWRFTCWRNTRQHESIDGGRNFQECEFPSRSMFSRIEWYIEESMSKLAQASHESKHFRRQWRWWRRKTFETDNEDVEDLEGFSELFSNDTKDTKKENLGTGLELWQNYKKPDKRASGTLFPIGRKWQSGNREKEEINLQRKVVPLYPKHSRLRG